MTRAGHLGHRRWEVPTPGAFVFFFWLLSLSPSLVSLSDEARAAYRFTDLAVAYGRGTSLAWMILFAVGLGSAPANSPAEQKPAKDLGVGFVFLATIWLVGASVASSHHMLSFWAAADAPATGSTGMSLVLVYLALTPMILPLALFARVRGTGATRFVGTAFLAVGIGGLFVFSSRRLWLVSLYACLSIVQAGVQAGRGVKLRWIAATVALALVGTGPLVWAFRSAQQAGTSAGTLEVAWTAVGDYATDERVRRDAAARSEGNLRSRLGISAILFGVTQDVLERGANFSPSLLEPLVRSIPSVIWPAKNEVAQGLSAQAQLHRMGRFPDVDLTVTPVTEFVLQVGPLWAPIGGILYGFLARLVNKWRQRAATSMPRFVAWLGLFIALSYFDGGTAALMGVREPLLAALAIWLASAAWRSVSA